MDVICHKFVYYSIIYYHYNHAEVSDSEFDNICMMLKQSWKNVPAWFKERVTFDDVSGGSGFGIIPSQKELDKVEKYLYNQLSIVEIQ